ncbi:MAG: capsular biosynthesis protein [Pseudomonadota bacterium]
MDRPQSRTILMLQGPPCGFWRALGQGLSEAGYRVIHVGFHLGDLLIWRQRGQRLYRGRLADWPAWLERLVREEGVNDILYYADRLPYHVAALGVARRLGVRAWAIENGYLRPDWLTMEPEGMGAQSHIPRDAEGIRRMAAGAMRPDMTPLYSHSFPEEATAEVSYHLAMALGRVGFLRYVSDKHYPPLLDYFSWLRRMAFGGRARRQAETIDAAVAETRWPFFLLALQLQSDYQIRASSPFDCLSEMLEAVVRSFAERAAAGVRLVIKLHPMDNGWENWPKQSQRLAERFGVADRVHSIDGGNLDAMLERARGVITVNSTVGLLALRRACPVIALGDAIYDVPGLTHQGGLDQFWGEPAWPDPALCNDLVAVLASAFQVRGSFYDPAGRRAAIAEITRRLTTPDLFWQAAFGGDAGSAQTGAPSIAAE